jgi:hypothetical protein
VKPHLRCGQFNGLRRHEKVVHPAFFATPDFVKNQPVFKTVAVVKRDANVV